MTKKQTKAKSKRLPISKKKLINSIKRTSSRWSEWLKGIYSIFYFEKIKRSLNSSEVQEEAISNICYEDIDRMELKIAEEIITKFDGKAVMIIISHVANCCYLVNGHS